MAQGVVGALADDAVVVIVGSETGSIYMDPMRASADAGQLINLLQMGDGAAAVVLAASGSRFSTTKPHAASGAGMIRGVYYGQLGHGSGSAFSLAAGGSDAHALAGDVAEFHHDFARVRRDGEALFQAGLAAGAALGATAQAVDCIIPHQANGHLAALLSAALECPAGRIFVNADRVANTGSAAIWLALSEVRSALPARARVLALGAEATRFMFGGFIYVHGELGDADAG
jgi:3-oxoacyl-[acyl-carrier-protein] synthase-3